MGEQVLNDTIRINMKKIILLIVISLLTATQASAVPVKIESWTDLDGVRSNLSEDYILTRNLLKSDKDYATLGADWTPVGTSGNAFEGTFDGKGHSIIGLTVDKAGTNYVGLFGAVNAATITNLNLIDVNVVGNQRVGALAGQQNAGSTENVFVQGTVEGKGTQTGGILGALYGPIEKCYADVDVTGINSVGGIVGAAQAATITDCYVTGTVSGSSDSVGGIIGSTSYGPTGVVITNCYADIDVDGAEYVGGLIGLSNIAASINNCFRVGTVTSAGSYVGGFMGFEGTTLGIADSGWWTGSGPEYAVGGVDISGPTNIDFNEADKTAFYDSNHDVFDTWSSPPWYWHDNKYPIYIEKEGAEVSGFVALGIQFE